MSENGVRALAIAENPHEGSIVLSSKTLGLISAGIYRSTASALKELVSNAFDADATRVRIDMNPPLFDLVSVVDDGTGMPREKFIQLMERQIGDSDKRSKGVLSLGKERPLIGRIGIGLLAIAQICHGFEVVSHHEESKTAFHARARLSEELNAEIDTVPPDEQTHLEIGAYDIWSIPYDGSRRGTQIIANDLKRGFLARFRAGPPTKRKEASTEGIPVPPRALGSTTEPPLPADFHTFFDECGRHRSLQELSEYRQTVWNVALMAPLPYLDESPVRDHSVHPERQEQLRGYDFRVAMEFLELRRPVLLPPRKADVRSAEDVHVEFLEIDQEVEGTPLKGSGYIYAQGGKSIYPAELRGMMIRIKGVAIGQYDKGFFDYPFIEGPRFGWLSGELFIDEGLEAALNIDRDSFNEGHAHYIIMRRMIHDVLDEKVRPWLYRNMDSRKEVQDRIEASKRDIGIADLASEVLAEGTRVTRHKRPASRKAAGDEFASPVSIDAASNSIEVNDAASWPRSARNRELAQALAVGFELALLASDQEERRRRFYSSLRRVLG